MSDQFVAEIRIYPFNFPPTGWAFCDGQLMPISQNTALFSLLGTFYGGDGQSTFALPDLQGNAPVFWGQGAELSEYFLGQTGGAQAVTLLPSEIPVHNHNVMTATDIATDNTPSINRVLTISNNGSMYAPATATPVVQMAPQALGAAGGSLPHNNMMPTLTLNFCIALQGIFPPRG